MQKKLFCRKKSCKRSYKRHKSTSKYTKNCMKKKFKKKTKKSQRTKGGNSGKTHIVKIWASWCGHCTLLNEIWPDIIKDTESPTLEFHDIPFENMENELKNLNDSLKLKGPNILELNGGYPTLLMVNEGITTPYNGPRDKESLLNWIRQ